MLGTLEVLHDVYRVSKLISNISHQVKVNQAQCKRLAERVDVLTEAIRSLESQIADDQAEHYKPALNRFLFQLYEAKNFIELFSGTKWYRHVVNYTAYDKRFQSINRDLKIAAEDLHLGISVHHQFQLSRDQSDRHEDFLALKALMEEKSEEIIRLNKEAFSNNMERLLEETRRETRQMSQMMREHHQLYQRQPEQQNLFFEILQRQITSFQHQVTEFFHQKSPSSGADLSPEVTSMKRLSEANRIEYCELTFDHFIRRSSFCDIFQGIWQGHPVIIKSLNERFTMAQKRDLYNEMLKLEQLRHPNIVSFYGGAIDSDHTCLVMEHMPGGVLKDYLISYRNATKQPVKLSQRRQIALDVAQGVRYLHGQGVLHRDLRGQHILMTSTGRAKLADFHRAASTMTQNTLRSIMTEENSSAIPWLAPECLKAKGKPTRASDIYSFATVLWELLTESLPYEGRFNGSEEDLAQAILSGHREVIPEELPFDYSDLIRRCWGDNPDERPSIEEVVSLLQVAVDEEALYQMGIREEQNNNISKAESFFRQAVSWGHAKAPTKLGDLATQGDCAFSEARDLKAAHQYYLEGASRGHVRAMVNLAVQFNKGHGVRQNFSEALDWAKKALEQEPRNAKAIDLAKTLEAVVERKEKPLIKASLFSEKGQNDSHIAEEKSHHEAQSTEEFLLKPKQCCCIS